MEDEDLTFEAYFSGRMNDAEANDFSKALENNPDLKEQYNIYLATKEASSQVERDKMRAELEEVDLEDDVEHALSKERYRPKGRSTIIKWVGSIAAMLLISFFAYNALQAPSSQDLFAFNFETYQVQAARGGNVDALKTLYTSGDYELFIEKALTEKESPELNMMLANAYLNQEKYNDAIKTLTKITDESSLRDQKYWYLGLSQIRLGNTEEAIANFTKLQSLSNYKKQETEEILSKIDNE